ncbi:2929_t:CDS:2 [Paraglomus brasilianum]|uniref:2929_t:CDS:1 n=1 Tax=Paraglomus brasilianum TaxID=144538 RepID=A0A9N8W0G9_9GLOM|nr:2929_t:CDS:2 [Paraglomus brasilianum]
MTMASTTTSTNTGSSTNAASTTIIINRSALVHEVRQTSIELRWLLAPPPPQAPTSEFQTAYCRG